MVEEKKRTSLNLTLFCCGVFESSRLFYQTLSVKVSATLVKNGLKSNNLGRDFEVFFAILNYFCDFCIIPNQAL